jgi:hypothetical protein
MSIARQIRLGLARVRIEQGTHPLDRFKIEVLDVPGLQPAVNGAPLQRARLFAQFFHAQLGILNQNRFDLRFRPFGFVSSDNCGSPERATYFSAKLLFNIRDDSVADPVAERIQGGIRRVVAKF